MDGSKHNDGRPVTEDSLLMAGYRKYSGADIDVYYSKDICQHAAECVRGNPLVWDVSRRPWVAPDEGTADDIVRVIGRCPSGALKYILKDKGVEE